MTDQRRPGTRNPRFGPGGSGASPQSRGISVTRNHDVIRRWAAQRGARPATVPGSEHDGRLGVLRFDFPGYGGAVLRRVGWDEWFATFDARNLRFWYQEPSADRPRSNFNRLEPPR
ncbi:hypothetical protein [Nocardia beijingensis]|uniref:hypothetical protein n=1 Tax=Nocardia beijingensis TaxID=95162 RepID=UPI001E299386|nr:hypothetical protein [Nocardia beijingensis]